VHTSQAHQGSDLLLLSLIITARTKKAALNMDKQTESSNLICRKVGGWGEGVRGEKAEWRKANCIGVYLGVG
jgi:hypothetical protein